MAPRRLVLAMILLLAISTVIAIVTPDPSRRDSEPAPQEVRQPGNRELEPSVTEEADRGRGEPEASRGGSPGPLRPEVMRVGGGIEVIDVGPDRRLVLEVRSDLILEVAIPKLGRTSTAGPYAPAVFDLITPPASSDLEVIEMPGGRPVGRIVVR